MTEGVGSGGVGIGTAIVSYIEPHPGAARDFNRWYERDHFPAAVLAGPGAYAGARFVAPRDCKDARDEGTLFGDPATGSYLSLAWLLPGAQADWDEWIPGQMEKLQAEDRMFAGRDHLHTGLYEYCWEARTNEGPPAFLALERGYQGLIAVAIEGEGDDESWARALVDPELPVVLALRRTRVLISTLGEPAEHVLLLGFVDGDAIDVWERVVEPVLAPRDDVGFAGPFFATVPGSDLFVEDL